MSATEAGGIAAVETPTAGVVRALATEAPTQDAPKKERAKRPRIDLDDTISEAKQAMKAAQKKVAEARKVGRNERRKKQRLLKKASGLSADDLERIAVLKRCGLDTTAAQTSATAQVKVMPPTAASASSGRPASEAAAGCGSPAQSNAGHEASAEEFDDERDGS